MRDDTIAAIATPPGSGAIAVIRVSGPQAFDIVEKIFKPIKPKKLHEQKGYTIHFGQIIDKNQQIIDEVLISIFHAPHSYTGEDSIEISCHGSVYIQQKILELLIDAGARIAEPGEFTMRAFLNGKLDLAQAEAVADLIASQSQAAHRIAMNQLKGGISNELKQLRQQLVDFASLIELELDFAEEDVEFADRQQLRDLILKIKQRVTQLMSTFQLGNAIKNGIPVAITGEPNVGKSTLLNLLLKEDKALVSDIPGTTRDSIEDIISINGILFRFIDTAGLRQTSDVIESMGIQRTKEKIRKASIILYLIDARDKNWKQKLSEIQKLITDQQHLIIVVNKIDLVQQKPKIDLPNAQIVYISAKHHQNIRDLEQKLLQAINYNKFTQSDIIITNSRHYQALRHANEAIDRVIQGLDMGLSNDLLAEDVRQIMYYLGEITGEITTDEILGNIFSKFCIGK